MFNKIIKFIKYHNAFTVVLAITLLGFSSAMASETVREAVLGESVVEKNGVDNSLLLAANIEEFDFQMKVTNVSEDKENYYVSYSFNTLAIEDNIWKTVSKGSTLDISKDFLGNKDLGLYVTEELGEIIDRQLSYLKEVRERETNKGQTFVTETTKYTGLIGLILNPKTKELPGYEPVVPEPEMETDFPESEPESESTTSQGEENLVPDEREEEPTEEVVGIEPEEIIEELQPTPEATTTPEEIVEEEVIEEEEVKPESEPIATTTSATTTAQE